MTQHVPGTGSGSWEQLNKCPDLRHRDMERVLQVGELIGLCYQCREHGRFRYAWDTDTFERVPERGA